MQGQIKVTDFEIGPATTTKTEMTEINAQVKVTHVFTAGEIIAIIFGSVIGGLLLLAILSSPYPQPQHPVQRIRVPQISSEQATVITQRPSISSNVEVDPKTMRRKQ